MTSIFWKNIGTYKIAIGNCYLKSHIKYLETQLGIVFLHMSPDTH